MNNKKMQTTDTQLLDKLIDFQLHYNTNCLKTNVEADLVQLKYYMKMKILILNDEPSKLFKKEYKEWQDELEYYNSKIKKYEEEFKFDSKELEDNIRLLSSMN